MVLQKPEALTTFGRSHCINNIYLDIKDFTPAIDGQLIPAQSGQGHWPFHKTDQEYFSDGLTEEIITDLSHINDLLVISRSSARTFKGTKKKISEIAKEVNVHYVLEGSVRKAGHNLRITAQLIDGINDSHIWSEKYSGTLDDVFDIQEKSIQSKYFVVLSDETGGQQYSQKD